MTERGTGLDVEDAVQLVQQRLTKNVNQFGAMVADDCVKASIFLGGVVTSLRRVGAMRLQDMPETRLQLWDQQVRRRCEISLEESGKAERIQWGLYLRSKRRLPNDPVKIPPPA